MHSYELMVIMDPSVEDRDVAPTIPRAGLNRRPHPYQGCALPLSYKGTSQNDEKE